MRNDHRLPYKSLKLQSTLISSYIIIILLTVFCISIPSYIMFRNSMIEELSHSRLDLLAQISNNVKKIQDELVTISNLYYHNPDLMNIISSTEVTEESADVYTRNFKEIDTRVKDTLSNYRFDYKVQLICTNSFSFTSLDMDPSVLDAYPKQLWYAKLISSKEDFYWLTSLTISGISPTATDYFSLVRKIKNEDNEIIAYLFISVDERVLYNTYKEQTTNGSSIYLVDTDGRIITHPIKTMVGKVFYDMKRLDSLFANKDNTFIKKLGSDYLFSRYLHSDYDWITIEEIPLINILKPIKRINTIVFVIALFVGTLSILLSLIIANSVSKPLTSVYNSMQKAQNGDFKTTFSKRGFSEARGIAIACESFIKRIVDLHWDLRSKDIEKHKLELDFLQAQINPHFLYNTLFTIKCMVDMKYTEEACTMIDSLTGILKAALGNSGQYTTIELEMELLKQYGFILLKRYRGLFSLNFNIDSSTNDLYILHFIIQPLIENSIFHGFASIKSGGKILVSSHATDEQVIISIEDNGCGMEQSKIDEVFIDTINYNHIGLKNVYKRIKLHYNEAANMIIESKLAHGTKIHIFLPKLLSPDSEV